MCEVFILIMHVFYMTGVDIVATYKQKTRVCDRCSTRHVIYYVLCKITYFDPSCTNAVFIGIYKV